MIVRRREFIALLGAAAVCPIATRAQQTNRARRIGVLLPGTDGDPLYVGRVTLYREGLQKLHWTDGENLKIDVRWGEGDADRNRLYAEEIVGLGPDAILASGTPPVRALKQATTTIPIVFVAVSDPVGDGFVESVARPGGNITGFSNYDPSMAGKWFQLVKDLAPATTRIALLYNPAT